MSEQDAPQVFVCGWNGSLTPAAQAELAEFAAHLKHRSAGEAVADCRFCLAALSRSRA